MKREIRPDYIYGIKIPNDRAATEAAEKMIIKRAKIKFDIFQLKKNHELLERIKKQGANFNIPENVVLMKSGKNISGLLLLQTEIPMEFSKTPKKIWFYLTNKGRIGLFSLETDDNGSVYWTNTQWTIKPPSIFTFHQESFESNDALYIIDKNFDTTSKMLVEHGFSADDF